MGNNQKALCFHRAMVGGSMPAVNLLLVWPVATPLRNQKDLIIEFI